MSKEGDKDRIVRSGNVFENTFDTLNPNSDIRNLKIDRPKSVVVEPDTASTQQKKTNLSSSQAYKDLMIQAVGPLNSMKSFDPTTPIPDEHKTRAALLAHEAAAKVNKTSESQQPKSTPINLASTQVPKAVYQPPKTPIAPSKPVKFESKAPEADQFVNKHMTNLQDAINSLKTSTYNSENKEQNIERARKAIASIYGVQNNENELRNRGAQISKIIIEANLKDPELLAEIINKEKAEYVGRYPRISEIRRTYQFNIVAGQLNSDIKSLAQSINGSDAHNFDRSTALDNIQENISKLFQNSGRTEAALNETYTTIKKALTSLSHDDTSNALLSKVDAHLNKQYADNKKLADSKENSYSSEFVNDIKTRDELVGTLQKQIKEQQQYRTDEAADMKKRDESKQQYQQNLAKLLKKGEPKLKQSKGGFTGVLKSAAKSIGKTVNKMLGKSGSVDITRVKDIKGVNQGSSRV